MCCRHPRPREAVCFGVLDLGFRVWALGFRKQRATVDDINPALYPLIVRINTIIPIV